MRIPDGWKLVPIEPTEEMCSFAIQGSAWETMNPPPRRAYKSMLSVAPTPPAQDRAELPRLVVYKSTLIPEDKWRNMPIDYWLREMLEHCDYHDGLVIKATLAFLEGLQVPAQEGK